MLSRCFTEPRSRLIFIKLAELLEVALEMIG